MYYQVCLTKDIGPFYIGLILNRLRAEWQKLFIPNLRVSPLRDDPLKLRGLFLWGRTKRPERCHVVLTAERAKLAKSGWYEIFSQFLLPAFEQCQATYLTGAGFFITRSKRSGRNFTFVGYVRQGCYFGSLEVRRPVYTTWETIIPLLCLI